MTAKQMRDEISSLGEGGQITADNRYDPIFLQLLLDSTRAFWIRDQYLKDKRLPAICYQKFYPEYATDLQPTKKCFKKFIMPDIIRLDEHSDGIRYAGSDDSEGNGTNAFDRVQSRAWLATYNQHPVMNVNNNRTWSFLYDASAKTLELRGNKASYVRTPMLECLFMHPLEIPLFNEELDDYPLPLDGFYAIEKMIFASDTRIVEATTPKVAFQPPNTPMLK